MAWSAIILELVWRNAVAVVPFAVLVGLLGSVLPLRPATRHTLWLVVLLAFLAPLPSLPRSGGAFTAGPPAAAPVVSPEPLATPSRVVVGTYDLVKPRGQLDGVAFELVPRTSQKPQPPADLREAIELIEADGKEPVDEIACEGVTSGAVDAPDFIDVEQPAACLPAQFDEAHCTTPTPNLPAEPCPALEAPAAFADDAVALAPEHNAPAVPPLSTLSARLDAWRTWLSRPPLELAWLLIPGVLVAALIGLLQYVRVRRCLSTSVAAPPGAAELVSAVAQQLGLRRLPRLAFVTARVSPMVTVGPRPRLMFPIRLWEQLRRSEREAVVCHELAHLRRWDHGVRLLQLLTNAIFWWHPFAWWVRRQLDEAAEACCDAWVTWLMPGRRRAYATALIKTSQFLDQSNRPASAFAIGALTAGGRRFARRVQMIMTHHTRPRLSLSAAAIAVALLGSAWAAAAVWHCPPEEEQPQESLFEESPDAPPALLSSNPDEGPRGAAPRAETPPPPREDARPRRARTPQPPATAAPPVQPPPVAPAHANPFGGEDRLARIERQLAELAEQVRALHGRPGAGPRPGPVPVPAPEAQMSGSDREVVIRHYALPEGKLDALLELMIREDVPVRVARVDGRIEVHAPESQQRVIEAFIHIIHPDGRPQQRRPRGQSSTNEMPGDPTVRAEVIAVPESSLDPLRSRVREHELEIRNLGRQAAEMEIRREELARAATDAEVRARSGLQERRERQLRNLEARTERARTTQEAEMLEQERLKFEQEMWNEELKLDERLQLERQQAENASRAIEQDRRRIELEMQALNDQMQAVQLEIERLQALRDEMRATYNMASP